MSRVMTTVVKPATAPALMIVAYPYDVRGPGHRRRDERVVVRAIDESKAAEDDEQDDEHLQRYEDQVDAHRLLDPPGDQCGEHRDQEERGQVEVAAGNRWPPATRNRGCPARS